MKNLQILLTLVLLTGIAYGESLGGYPNITIYGNEDPGACKLTLWMEVQADKVVFHETVQSGTGQSCTYQNLQFANVFRGDALYGNITLANTSTANEYQGSFTLDDVKKYNGTACGTLQVDPNAPHYACRFKYGSIFFQIGLFDNANGTFDTTWTDLLFPNFGSTSVNSTNGVTLLTPNYSFPWLVGMLYNACGSWSTVITDPNASITVTGTEYASNVIDLHNYLSDIYLNDIIVRKRGGAQDQYIVYAIPSDLTPFANAGTNGCTQLNFTWGQVLNNDWSYCADGCDVSFVMQGREAYILWTSGITTRSARNLRG